ncbi:hypothetical protein BH10ACT6_BH10ACT6_00790 [soil metagenome]
MTSDVRAEVRVDRGAETRLLRLRIRERRVPVTAVLLVGYVLSRGLSTGLFAAFWRAFPDGLWSTAHLHGDTSFLSFLNSWDSRWYQQVALHGYPTTLPVDAAGDVTYNTWAFFPLFPAIARGLMAVTGLPFEVAGMVVSTVFGAAAMLVLHRVLLVRFSHTQALWGAMLFAFGPLSFLLQVAYAESTFLFFLFTALWFMQHKRYLAMTPFALIASFTHPGALALAAALGIQGLHRLWRRHPIPHREWISGVVAILAIVGATLLWPLIASAVIGNPGAYFDTELAWWRAYFGPVIFVPFSPFFLLYGHLWGIWGVLAVLTVAAAVTFWLTRNSTRVYGVDLWTFTVSYIAYLFAVFLPTQSLLRMLLPLSPLLGHPGLSRTHRRRVISLAVSIAVQPIAIYALWVVYPP